MIDFSTESIIKTLIEKHGFSSAPVNDFLKKSGKDFDVNALEQELLAIQRDAEKATILLSSLKNEHLLESAEAADTPEGRMERHAEKFSSGIHEVPHLVRSALDPDAS